MRILKILREVATPCGRDRAAESPSALGCGPSIPARCHFFFSPWLLTFSTHWICSPWMKNNHPWGCWEGRILCSEAKPKGALKPHFAESTSNFSSASGWGTASLPSSLTCQRVHAGKAVWWAGAARALVAAFGIENAALQSQQGPPHRTKSRGDMQKAGGAAAGFGVGEVYLQGLGWGQRLLWLRVRVRRRLVWEQSWWAEGGSAN